MSGLIVLLQTAVGLNIGSAYDCTFLTLQPTYTINKPDAIAAIVDTMVTAAKKDMGFVFCGYSTTRSLRSTSTVGGYAVEVGDNLFGRLAFPDADALKNHLATAPDSASLLADVATLKSLEIHGPAAELAKLSIDGANMFEIESGLSRLERETGAAMLPIQAISVHSRFTIKDAAAAKPICAELIERTVKETDCLYSSWTRCGDELYLREAFGSVVGIARHVDNVGDLLSSLSSEGGPATLDSNELHASLGNMRLFDEYISDTAKGRGFKGLDEYCGTGTTTYYSEAGFSKYDVQQSVFGRFIKKR